MSVANQHHTPHSNGVANFSPPLHSGATMNSMANLMSAATSASSRPVSDSILGDLSKSAIGDVSRRLNEKTNEIKSLVTNERRLQLALQTLERDFNHNRQLLEEVESDRVVLQERIADRERVIDTLKERLEKMEFLHEEDRARIEKMEKDAQAGTQGLSTEIEQLRQRNLHLIEERNVARLQAAEAQQNSEAVRKDCELQLAQVRSQLDCHREDIRIGVIREFEDKTASLKSKVDQSEGYVKDSNHRVQDVQNELQRALNENARIVRSEQVLKGQLMQSEKDVERLEMEAKELNRRHHVEIEEWRRKAEYADEQLATLKKSGTHKTSEIHVAYEKKCADLKVLENQIEALRQEHERNLKKLRIQSQTAVEGIELKVEALEEKARHAARERDHHKDAEDRARRQLEDTRQEADRHAAERDAKTDEVQEIKRKLQQKERDNLKLQSELNFSQKLVQEKEAEVEGMCAAMFLRERRDQREMSTLSMARAAELKRSGRLRCGHQDNTSLVTRFGPSIIDPQSQLTAVGNDFYQNSFQQNSRNRSMHSMLPAESDEPRLRDDSDRESDEDVVPHSRRVSRATSRQQRRAGRDHSSHSQQSRSTSKQKAKKLSADLNVSDPEGHHTSASEADNTNVLKPKQDTANATIIRLYEQLLATEREKSQLNVNKATVVTTAQQIKAQQAADESVRLRSERLAALDALTQVQAELNAAHEQAAKAERAKLDAEAHAERLERERLRAVTSGTVASTIHPDTTYTSSRPHTPSAPLPQKPVSFSTAPQMTSAKNHNTSDNSARNTSSSHIQQYTSPSRRLEEMKEKILAMSTAKSAARFSIEELAESY